MFLPASNTLLSHYVDQTGNLLATAPTGLNPFMSSVISIAYNDDLVMHCMLALSGSHLAFKHGDDSTEIQQATHKHYRVALRTLQRVISGVSEPTATLKLLLCMILLCHYEVLSESLAGSMFAHLRACRQLILYIRTHRHRIQTAEGRLLYGIILELYSYIVLTNSITPYGMLPSRTLPIDPFLLKLGQLSEFETFGVMFGGSHGIFELLLHVSVHVAQTPDESASDAVSGAEKYETLKTRVIQWTPAPITSTDTDFLAQRTAVMEFLRQVVLLYVETVPSVLRTDDEHRMQRIQELVDMARLYLQRENTSPYQCIALWALIVLGSFVIREEEREDISNRLLRNKFKMRNTVQARWVLGLLWVEQETDKFAIGPYGLGLVMRKFGLSYAVM
ncbi:fungal-specific transcription factor domain-containing protein [Aspergillus karnatakaensis]|uniref:transcription factor domain-containing protein n=1 Tax=Aspergillus karnatakaensis TaxID=1810916 RepID=UPI003CCD78A7